MKYVDWLEHILAAVLATEAEVPPSHLWGVAQVQAKLQIVGEHAEEATHDALRDLDRYGWIDFSQHHMQVFQAGREAAAVGVRSGWRSLFERFLTPAQEQLLADIVLQSEQRAEDHAWLKDVLVGEDAGADLDGNAAWKLVNALVEAQFIDNRPATLGRLKVFPTYGGVVRATERVNSELQELVLGLLPDWETANVDFKRELALRSKDQKIELARDVIALANTQVTARRYLVIGFDPKTHAFAPGLDPKITQDVIEDILNHLVRPAVAVRFQQGDWIDGTGFVGIIEVVRDRAALPYAARRDTQGAKRRLTEGDIFIRRGSHVSIADDTERDALVTEGKRARDSH